MEVLYSFIIPHKNCRPLLNRCIDSIPIRDDIQIIVVDDNSSPENKPIIEREDTQIVWLNASESKGAGHARNVGLKHAKGKWLMFADADDSFTENLSSFLDKYSNDDIHDLVIVNACGINKEGNQELMRHSTYVKNYQNKRVYSEKVIRYGLWAPWSRMVRRSLVEENNIHFEEVEIGNDIVFGLECSKYARTIEVEPMLLYNYYLPSGVSITNSYRKKFSNIELTINHFIYRTNLYKEVGYIFKPCHLLYALSFRTDRSRMAFLKEYYNHLRGSKYSICKDLYYLFLYILGRTLNII